MFKSWGVDLHYLPLIFVSFCMSRCAPGFLGEYCHHKDPCHPGYCLNGGNCSVSISAGVPVPGSATCFCPLGYTGQHCQIPQNSTCYPNNPCANQGVCTLLSLDRYKCKCARGWTGEIWSPQRFLPLAMKPKSFLIVFTKQNCIAAFGHFILHCLHICEDELWKY